MLQYNEKANLFDFVIVIHALMHFCVIKTFLFDFANFPLEFLHICTCNSTVTHM